MKGCLISLAMLLPLAATAELKNVEVGGMIHIRGRYWNNTFSPLTPRFPRPYGRPLGPFGSASRHAWDDQGAGNSYVEQRTILRAHAEMTNDVDAVIALESYDVWSEDFRSAYIAGSDSRAKTDNDIEIMEAFIDTNEVLNLPFRIRIGRQALSFDDGWLVFERASSLRAFLYDGVRATVSHDPWILDAFWTKLDENSPTEQDGDVDFAGVHATWAGSKSLEANFFWYWLRDARATSDTQRGLLGERLEQWVGLDNYPTTNLHTLGTRIDANRGPWDVKIEAAYQFGDAAQAGIAYRRFVYGDDDAVFDAWAADIEARYTMDSRWAPQFHLGGAYFSGEDNRDVSFWEWLFAPIVPAEASVSFNRLFSGRNYSRLFDSNKDLTNFWQLRTGVEFTPIDDLRVFLRLAYYEVVEPFDRPLFPPLGTLMSFLTRESSTDLGTSAQLVLTYDITEDLRVRAGWEHLFTGGGFAEGSYTSRYGHQFMGGTAGEDADYIYFESILTF